MERFGGGVKRFSKRAIPPRGGERCRCENVIQGKTAGLPGGVTCWISVAVLSIYCSPQVLSTEQEITMVLPERWPAT